MNRITLALILALIGLGAYTAKLQVDVLVAKRAIVEELQEAEKADRELLDLSTVLRDLK